MAIFAAAAALAGGCGEDDFENEPRPPVPMELTGVIQDDKVTVSPSKNIGAGPFTGMRSEHMMVTSARQWSRQIVPRVTSLPISWYGMARRPPTSLRARR